MGTPFPYPTETPWPTGLTPSEVTAIGDAMAATTIAFVFFGFLLLTLLGVIVVGLILD